MRLNITDIKRINTCGYLKKNNWDYEQVISSNPSYLIGMKEILRWHYKRNKAIDTESFLTFLGNFHARTNIDHDNKINIEKAFREFINSSFYRNLDRVFINYLSDIKISSEDYLEYAIPVFINLPSKPSFIYYDIGKEDKHIFLQRYEVMHNAIWSFYYLNKLPTFINIWFDKETIRYETIKVDEKYILRAKRMLITIGKNLNIFVVPTIQTCKNCSRITECDRFKEIKRGKNVKGL